MRRGPRPPNLCRGPGCGRAIERWKWLCGGCFKRLPWDKRRGIAGAERHLLLGLVEAACAWLAAHPPGAPAARVMGEADG